MRSSKTRIEWIDSEKGFVLLLVCMFHLGIFSFLPACRIPIFFFLSGLLFSNKRYPSFISFVKRKWDTLLLPYFLLSIFSIICFPKLYDGSTLQGMCNTWVAEIFSSLGISGYFHSFLTKLSIFTIDILMGHSSPTSIGLWFVYSLFQITCVFYLTHRIFVRSKYNNLLFGVLSIGCLITGWYLSFNHLIIPFKIPTMITGLGFYSMGFLSKSFLLNPNYHPTLKHCIIGLFPLLLLFIIGNKLISENIVFRLNYLPDSLGGFMIASISGTWLVTFLFLVIGNCNNSFISKLSSQTMFFLRLVAENGLVILAVHLWAICWFNYFFIDYNNHLWYPLISLLWVVVVTGCMIPVFNKYLYWMIGKKNKKI